MKANLSDFENFVVTKVFFGSEIVMLRENDVNEIKYHYPMGEGDKHFVDIYFNGGYAARRFNPDYVEFKPTEESEGDKE